MIRPLNSDEWRSEEKVMARKKARRRSIIKLIPVEARRYFLKGSSYCNFELPPYIVFEPLLYEVDAFLKRKNLSSLQTKDGPRFYEKVNHIIYNSKDGMYAWRPLQLIHPVLYVSLIHKLTTPKNWAAIRSCFKKFTSNKKIKCLSIPVKSLSSEKDKAEQIKQWWQDVEQESVALSIDYEYLIQTDITDCYGSIYTHSVAWALHGKKRMKGKKNRKNKNLLGNIIDKLLQDMNYGQTNGIPQGSNVMDFIAEILFGYADSLLTKELKKQHITDYHILRYRDDYRIFVNNTHDGEDIIKILTEVLIGLGLKLNPAKTDSTHCIVRNSIKKDKWGWICRRQADKNIQKHLMIIHDHASTFPNAGTLVQALTEYHRRVLDLKKIDYLRQLIGIVVDIACHNPKVYPVVSAIISKFISLLSTNKEKHSLLAKIKKRFNKIPNAGYMQIWLQRILLVFDKDFLFKEPVCRLVSGRRLNIWNNDWISCKELKSIVRSKKLIDETKIKELTPVIQAEEIELFVRNKTLYH